MDLHVESTAYQAQLEHLRAARDRDMDPRMIAELEADLQRAAAALWAAYYTPRT